MNQNSELHSVREAISKDYPNPPWEYIRATSYIKLMEGLMDKLMSGEIFTIQLREKMRDDYVGLSPTTEYSIRAVTTPVCHHDVVMPRFVYEDHHPNTYKCGWCGGYTMNDMRGHCSGCGGPRGV